MEQHNSNSLRIEDKKGMDKAAEREGSQQPPQKGSMGLKSAAISGAQAEVVQRYGSAAKEFYVAYSGVDNETGQILKRGLRGIAQSKVNPQYQEQNIKQQAGFSAEVKTAAQENAQKIIQGKSSRITRTDDLERSQITAGGAAIGGTNDQLFDLVEVAQDGNVLEGTARQLKYVGKNYEDCCTKLLSRKYDKYREAGAKIEIPSDLYLSVKTELDDRIGKLEEWIKNAEQKGDTALAKKHRASLQRVRQTRDSLKRGKLSSEEAVFARMHPGLSTAGDIVKTAHQAGLQGAKIGAGVGGVVSIIKNLVAYVKGEETIQEAGLSVAGETAFSSATGYGGAFAGSALAGSMKNSSHELMRDLSKTNLPGALVSVAITSGAIISRFASGEITGTECLNELGESGTGMVGSALFAAVGQAAIPVPVLGGLIGGMLGYAVASGSYQNLMQALNEAELAKEERTRIEATCAEHIELIRQYRQEMEEIVGAYLSSYMETFHGAFSDMKNALSIGDVDGFIASGNRITESLGQKPLFQNMDELDRLMANADIIKL